MKHYLALFTMFLGLSTITACRENSPPQLDKQSHELAADTDETSYCTNAGQCLASGSTCCSHAIQTTHTTCHTGKCCRPIIPGVGAACSPGKNQCCYPHTCQQYPIGWWCT
jgi:hypothetical protein